MSKFSQLKQKLNEVMHEEICKNSLENLKSLINYDEHRFYNVSQLRSHIKNNSEPDDDDAIYCISILFEIQMIIEKYNECGSLPMTNRLGEPTTLAQLVEQENNNKRTNTQKFVKPNYTDSNIEKPLVWEGITMRDYFSLDLTNLEIARKKM